jgi:anti-sigma B factor antagonist
VATAEDSHEERDPPAADHPTNPPDSGANGSAGDPSVCVDTGDLLALTVQYPMARVCVVVVDGELDALTAPLLEACVCEQLAALPAHLILDLQAVRFLGSSGLNCLLKARELALQTAGVRLHLAGVVTRVVARPLEVTGLLERFDTYPTLSDALAAVTE